MTERVTELSLADPAATEALGAALAAALNERGSKLSRRGLLLGLEGPLGAGKTTLARALLRALGVHGAVRSPTYTLVEPYQVPLGEVRHLDLYRLADPGELEQLGAVDLREEAVLSLIEWPEQGGRLADDLDLILSLRYTSEGDARSATLRPGSAAGEALLTRLQQKL